MKKVIVIDDNTVSLVLIAKILTTAGYKAVVTDDAVNALEKIRSEKPSLIILDIEMPEITGFELCRKIKTQDDLKDIPVIFLTANQETDTMVEGFQSGGVDFITKPFRKEELYVRVRNHIELAESRKTIVEMNNSRDKLYSIIAHDIRSPLAGILQTIDAIDQGFFDPSSELFSEIIRDLKNRTNETNTLLNSLLQWTRMQDKNVALNLKMTNIYELMKSCISLLELNAKEKNIGIELKLKKNFEAFCDEVSTHTVFRNLINNAIKFTPENGKVIINGKSGLRYMEVSIEDTGVGMSAEVINKILVENEHYTSFGTHNEKGTGLGLMIVKNFIQRNKGLLKIESEVGAGSKFTVCLPSLPRAGSVSKKES
ncbi:MAG: hybrid sensor histidine kinase/response regulator [Paludibacter sp.]|nr:MAG: hybrid sensor histidine kinase/response regulator [Paludibacter sp.]